MKFRFDESAMADVDSIADYYALEDPRQAARFIEDLFYQARLYSLHPNLGYELADGYRQFLLKHFPYTAIYAIDPTDRKIIVVAVGHQSRRPDYWRGRIQEESAVYQLAA